jgi:phage-related protein
MSVDISWKQVILGVMAMGMVAAVIQPSAFDEHPTTAAPAPAQAQTKVIVEKHTMPQQPDGYISEQQCARIPVGMQVADLMWKFGWPSSDYAYSAFADRFFYPVHDRRDDKCVIEFDDNKVTSVLYRVD